MKSKSDKSVFFKLENNVRWQLSGPPTPSIGPRNPRMLQRSLAVHLFTKTPGEATGANGVETSSGQADGEVFTHQISRIFQGKVGEIRLPAGCMVHVDPFLGHLPQIPRFQRKFRPSYSPLTPPTQCLKGSL